MILGEEAALEKIPVGDVALWVRQSMLFHCAREGTLSGFDEDFVSISLPEKLLVSISSFPLHFLYPLLLSISSSYFPVNKQFFFALYMVEILKCVVQLYSKMS